MSFPALAPSTSASDILRDDVRMRIRKSIAQFDRLDVNGRGTTPSIADLFVVELQRVPSNSVRDLNLKRKRQGDLWEAFGCLLLSDRGYARVSMLCELSDCERARLGLGRRDVGIDLVAFLENGDPCAVQCKFRAAGRSVTWRELSTFHALCERTGPWVRRIVITNAASVRREGHALDGDVAICRRQLTTMQRHVWEGISGLGKGRRCTEEAEREGCDPTHAEGWSKSRHDVSDPIDCVRNARIRRFGTPEMPTSAESEEQVFF